MAEQDVEAAVGSQPSEAPPRVVVRREPPVRVVTWYERHGKRILDLVVALVLCLVLLPLLAATALAVRLSLGPGVLYVQERVGRGGRTFRIYKFRSMLPDRRGGAGGGSSWPGPERRTAHKTERDPRHTRLGRLIRRIGLDELPQLWNILRGDMSLVGPRPEITWVAERYGIVDHVRHQVRPGVTGPWQLSPYRQEPIALHLEPDEDYVRKLTLRHDLGLVARTAGSFFGARGA